MTFWKRGTLGRTSDPFLPGAGSERGGTVPRGQEGMCLGAGNSLYLNSGGDLVMCMFQSSRSHKPTVKGNSTVFPPYGRKAPLLPTVFLPLNLHHCSQKTVHFGHLKSPDVVVSSTATTTSPTPAGCPVIQPIPDSLPAGAPVSSSAITCPEDQRLPGPSLRCINLLEGLTELTCLGLPAYQRIRQRVQMNSHVERYTGRGLGGSRVQALLSLWTSVCHPRGGVSASLKAL